MIICLLYTFHFKRNNAETFDVSCDIFNNVIISNAISLVLRAGNTDSENDNLIRRSVHETMHFKGCTLIGIK